MERVDKIDERDRAVSRCLEECRIDRELWVDPVCQRSGDAKRWSSASTDGPEQIGVLVCVGNDMGGIGKDDRYLDHIVCAWNTDVDVRSYARNREERGIPKSRTGDKIL